MRSMEQASVHVPKILAGFVLTLVAWTLNGYVKHNQQHSDMVLERLNEMAVELHQLRVNTERRLTRLETAASCER